MHSLDTIIEIKFVGNLDCVDLIDYKIRNTLSILKLEPSKEGGPYRISWKAPHRAIHRKVLWMKFMDEGSLKVCCFSSNLFVETQGLTKRKGLI